MRIGVVGCGYVAAESHMPFIVKQKNVDRVVVTDFDPQKAEALAKRYGVEALPNFEAMLQSRSVDVVHILTPPKTHAELAIRAIEAGCHVFVEKPMALTVEESDAMNAAAERNHVKLCVGHSRLCAPCFNSSRSRCIYVRRAQTMGAILTAG